MKILITGAKGFIGKNLTAELMNRGYHDLLLFDVDTKPDLLEQYTKECDFVYHLAGINRPKNDKEFMEGNYGFTSVLTDLLKKNNNNAPILISSSIHAAGESPYGLSKKAGEDAVFDYSRDTKAAVYVFRLPNLFGKWSRPNYNSVVATFCHNIAHDKEIQINNPNAEMNLCYIDDLVSAFIGALKGEVNKKAEYCEVEVTHSITLGELAEKLIGFRESRVNLTPPDMSDEFTKKLYATYLSYLPTDMFAYPLKMNIDDRGSFTEFIRTSERGQVSVNISKPGITKGNHWHHTKNEKFLVVSGEGIIRFRDINSKDIIEYKVSGNKLEVVDIPTGYTHNIENTGDTDMVTIMWANECYNPDKPDTYFLEV